MSEIPITDDEVLYRRILDGKDLYEIQANGTVQFNSQAFAERSCRPSVYRAKLCDNDPIQVRGTYPDSGVTSLVVRDVRSIDDLVQYNKDGDPAQKFVVGVEHKPISDDPVEPDNFAHAEIYTEPICPRGVCKRLRDRLALLANARQWELRPASLS